MTLQEDDLRLAKFEDLSRLANWLGVTKKKSKNPKEDFSFLIYGILRAMKKLEKLPKGIVPSDIKRKLER